MSHKGGQPLYRWEHAGIAPRSQSPPGTTDFFVIFRAFDPERPIHTPIADSVAPLGLSKPIFDTAHPPTPEGVGYCRASLMGHN